LGEEQLEGKKLEPRSRPRQARSRRRVEFILDTAEQLVQRFGYAAVTTQMISQETKISPGVLYHYFPGKHGIFAAIVQRAFVRLEDRMAELYATISREKTVETFLDEVVGSLVDFWAEHRAAILVWYSLEYDPHMDPITSAAQKAAIRRNSVLVRYYRPELTKGEVTTKALVLEEVSLCLLRQTLILKPRARSRLITELKELLRFVVTK
jgi:AcrR family transcriptional regulator